MRDRVRTGIGSVFFGIKAKRDDELNGVMSFGQGVKTGFLIAVVQTTITTLWFWVYGSLINTQFLDSMLEFERSKMVAAGTPLDNITASINSLKTLYSFPILQIFQELFGIAYGVIVALIFAAFLRRKIR